VDWIHLAQDRDRWRALGNLRNFLRTLLHIVSWLISHPIPKISPTERLACICVSVATGRAYLMPY
jgi:hypothetical protein